MKKICLYLILFFNPFINLYSQTPYNPFINNIHYSPEPSASGFECGTINYISLNGGLTTIDDATQWQTEPLVVRICVGGFLFYGSADSCITGSFASHFTWVYDSIIPNCAIGTQKETLFGTGSNPLFPNPLASGTISAALIANANAPQGNVLSVDVQLIVPPYMSAYNSIPDDHESSQTQTYFTGYTLSSAGTIAGSRIFCVNGDADEFISITPATGGQSGNFYYQWQEKIGPDWIDIPGATNLTYDAPNTFFSQYYRRRAKGTLCDNWLSTDSVTVIIDSLPIVGIDAGSTTMLNCNTNSTIIGLPSVLGYNYTWTPAIGLDNDTIAQPLATPLVTTTYFLSVVDTNGCTAFDSVLINVNNIASSVNAGADKYLNCVITSTIIGPTAEQSKTYQWSPPIGLNATNISQPIANPLSTTTYTLNVIDSNGCAAMDEVTVYVNNVAQIPDAGPDKNLNCVLTSVTLGPTSINGFGYSWSPSNGLSATNIAQPIANPTINTTYTLTTIDTNGCIANDQLVVYVDNTPPIAEAGLDKFLDCIQLSSSIGNLPVVGNSYNWIPSIGLNYDTISNPITTANITTQYTVTVTGANGCTSVDSVLISVDKIVPIANAGPDKNLDCSSVSTIIGTPSGSTYTYSWLPNNGLSATNLPEPTANPNSTTTYTLTVTATSGCTASDEVIVNVNNSSPLADAGDAKIFCNGEIITIGTAGIAGYTYSWVPSTGLSSATVAQPIASPAVTTIYTVTVTAPNGCTATDIVEVLVDICTINISGNVYNDTNALLNFKVDGIGIGKADSTQLFINLIDSNGYTYRVSPVSNTGYFEFLNIPMYQTFTATLSELNGLTGLAPPAVTLPSVWQNTGEDCCDSTGDDGIQDGVISFTVQNTNLQHIDFGIKKSIILPAHIVNFNVSELHCKNLLTWTTMSEQNTSHVDVLRKSPTNSFFSKIASIESAGTSNLEKAYSYYDQDVEMNKQYEYQLKFVDIDRLFYYSGIKTIQPTCNETNTNNVQIYPIPASNELTVVFQLDKINTVIGFEIVDITGRTIVANSHFISNRSSNIKLDIASLASGSYFFKFKDEEGELHGTIKFIKLQ